MNRNALFAGGIRPHHYCLPVLKTEADRAALLEAVASGDPRFFLGTDSAPHARHTKEAACGCAGIFSAHAGIELYAEVFEAAGRAAASWRASPRIRRGLLRPAAQPRTRSPSPRSRGQVPAHYPFGADELVPLRAGERIAWRVVPSA